MRSALTPDACHGLGDGSKTAFLCLQEAMKLPKNTPEERER